MPSPFDADDFDHFDERETEAMRAQELVEYLNGVGLHPSWAEDEIVRGYFRARQDVDRPETPEEDELFSAPALLYSSESQEEYLCPVKDLLRQVYSVKISTYIRRAIDAQDLEEVVYGPIAQAENQETTFDPSGVPAPRFEEVPSEPPLTQRQIRKEARKNRREIKRAAHDTGPHAPPGAPNGHSIELG